MRGNLMRGMWALAAMLALTLSGCGAASSVSAQVKPSATVTATATPLPALAWTPVSLPASFNKLGDNLAISSVDGHDAWMCQATSANTYVVWKTTDAGVTWSKTGHFSYTAPIAGAWCGLSADQNGTSALLATIGWGCGECGNLASASVFSADGATNWRPLSGVAQNGEFASVPGGFIAVVSKATTSQQNPPQYLAFSSDGFQTWRAMSSQGLPTQFFHFATSPDGATLIGSGYNNTLWRSTDLGAHWTQLPSPGGQQTGLNVWMPQRQAFLLCGNNIQPNAQMFCSTDLGVHWSAITVPAYTFPCPAPGKCGQGVTTQTNPCPPSFVTPDGAIIDSCPSNNPAPETIVYRYPLGGSAWQTIGSSQCSIKILPASGPDWCSSGTPDQLTGYKTGQLPG
jgi:hypothetical protein